MKKATTASKSYLQLGKTLLQKSYVWLLLMAVLWLVWLLAKIVWLFLAPPIAPTLKPVPLMPSQNQQNINQNALDMFARPQPQVINTPPPDIKVVGVTIATNHRFSFAMLNMNNKIRSYRIGDLLDNSPYQLAEVKADYIILRDMNGQTTKIEFANVFLLDQSTQNRAKNPQNPTVANNTLTNMSVPPPITNNSSVIPDMSALNAPVTPTHTPPVANSMPLNDAISKLEQDPSGFLNNMGVTTSEQGYTVTDNMPASIRDRLGLQSGDKVISVNGQTVGQNPAQDAQLLRQVQQSGQAQIQVQRGDQVITVRQSF